MNDMNTAAAITHDAHEFGAHVRQGGWRLGLLVARNVDKTGKGGRPKTGAIAPVNSKISATEFGKTAGTTKDRVVRYLDAWELAADAGHVKHAAELTPGQDYELKVDSLPEWNDYYPPGGTDLHRADPVTREIYENAAKDGDTTPGEVARIAKSPKAVAAAIEADPVVREAAGRALDKHYDRERSERRAARQAKPEPVESTQDQADHALEILAALTAITAEIRKATDLITSGTHRGDYAPMVSMVDWQINALGVIRSALADGVDLDAELAKILNEG